MSTRTDLGPLLAAVGDEWERGLDISRRAGIDPRTAGPRLASLARTGLVDTSRTNKFGGVTLYRRGPKAPPLPVTNRAEEVARAIHDSYDRYDRQAGRAPQPWETAPDGDKDLLLAVAADLLTRGVVR